MVMPPRAMPSRAMPSQAASVGAVVNQPPTERVAGPGWHPENRTILDSLAYARRLGVSRSYFQDALKVKLDATGASRASGASGVCGGEKSQTSSPDGQRVAVRQSVRALADRIAYPTDWVQNRNPMPLWYVKDIEHHEQNCGNDGASQTSGGRWVRRAQRLADYREEEIVQATSSCGLTEKETEVILGRYGLGGLEPESQATLAEILDVSERTVRNMEQRASEKVEAWLEQQTVEQPAVRPAPAVGEFGPPSCGPLPCASAPCARCVTPQSSYASVESMLCGSCEDLYRRVHDEVCREKASLKAQADKFSFYRGDCRPYRRAFMLNLPLFALNRLARTVEAEDRGYGYAAAGALKAGELLYAGNLDLLSQTWHYGPKRLQEGLDYLKRAGKIERRGVSPRDRNIEFWAVLAPYERPNLDVTLRRNRRIIPR